MASGLLGSLLGNVGLIQKGAEMMGFTMPSWATGAMDIAATTFGSKGGAGSAGGGGRCGTAYNCAGGGGRCGTAYNCAGN